jgi:ribose transport system ATP-binding protein
MTEQGMTTNGTEIIQLDKITKRFGGVTALDDVSFGIRAGEVHAVVGENGAGKSTLMKILSGVHQPDEGKIFIDDKEVAISSSRVSEELGIAMVYQELSLFQPLTVAANLFVGRELNRGLFLDERGMRRHTSEVLERLLVDIDPKSKVETLSHGQQQIVEIARAVSRGTRIVIMDEPNSALNQHETKALFQVINNLKDSGITILYVSHRLEEVFAISDRVTVLRDGHYIGTWDAENTTIEEIVTNVVGRRLGEIFPEKARSVNGRIVLSVDGLKLKDDTEPIGFMVRKGEVLGFAGLEGSGVQDVFSALFGLKKFESEWDLIYQERKVRYISPEHLINLKWAFIPAERRAHGLMLDWSILKNVSIVIMDRIESAIGLLKHKLEREVTQKYVDELDIATESIEKEVGNLSGGNQQKVVLAKWLATQPEFLILNDPTRGIDVGTKQEIYRLIQSWADQGYTILFTSSEIEEVVGLSHRILAFYRGEIIHEFDAEGTTKEEVMHYVLGGEAAEKAKELNSN